MALANGMLISSKDRSQDRERWCEETYFFWPVAWLKVSETAWPALPRLSWTEPMMPWPCWEALSLPERVASPSFWLVDLWPSMEGLVHGHSEVVQGQGNLPG